MKKLIKILVFLEIERGYVNLNNVCKLNIGFFDLILDCLLYIFALLFFNFFFDESDLFFFQKELNEIIEFHRIFRELTIIFFNF